jgi:hypothetical protein
MRKYIWVGYEKHKWNGHGRWDFVGAFTDLRKARGWVRDTSFPFCKARKIVRYDRADVRSK